MVAGFMWSICKAMEAGVPQPQAHSGSFDKTHRDAINHEARMMFAKGIKQNIIHKVACDHWESCPPIKKIPYNGLNLVGCKVGRLTVIGMARESKGRWVVRCACGDYEIRTAKAIRNPENKGDRCSVCRGFAQSRRSFEYHMNLVELDPRDL